MTLAVSLAVAALLSGIGVLISMMSIPVQPACCPPNQDDKAQADAVEPYLL